jgi:hypothetical protein
MIGIRGAAVNLFHLWELTESKHMLQRSNSRWDDNIKMDLEPTGVKRLQ